VDEPQTPAGVREDVRTGILGALERDVELRGSRAARLLVLAGAIGVVGALGATLLVTRHPFEHHDSWHLATFSTAWAGILIVALAVSLLRLRTPTLPLAHAVSIGLLALGIAGACSLACPDQHFLAWWSSTTPGALVERGAGAQSSAFCFGAVTTAAFATLAALLAAGPVGRAPIRPLLPAATIAVLLAPGVALQSVGTSVGVFAGWLVGATAGAYAGVALGARLGAALGLHRT
jgi:hypothetical protein